MINHSSVDSLFLNVWLKVHKFQNDQLDLRTKKSKNSVTYQITNETVLSLLETEFQDFQSKKMFSRNIF